MLAFFLLFQPKRNRVSSFFLSFLLLIIHFYFHVERKRSNSIRHIISLMSNSSLVQNILIISEKLDFYISIIITIAGLISNLMIILILTNLKIFRRNQCAFYLIIECSANIGLLSIIFSSRILAYILQIDPVHRSQIWCRLRSWATQVFAFISLFTICSATFDQYLSTNLNYSKRRLSTIYLAYYLILIIVSFAVLHNIPLLIFTEINSLSKCSVSNGILRYYFNYFYYPIVVCLLPVTITSTFSLLAYRNVRRIIRRQIPLIRRRLDRQLTAMILARVICLIVLCLPYVIYSICMTAISIKVDNYLGLAIQKLVEVIILALFYTNYSICFYIYALISSRFQRQIRYFLTKKIVYLCQCNRQISPENEQSGVIE